MIYLVNFSGRHTKPSTRKRKLPIGKHHSSISWKKQSTYLHAESPTGGPPTRAAAPEKTSGNKILPARAPQIPADSPSPPSLESRRPKAEEQQAEKVGRRLHQPRLDGSSITNLPLQWRKTPYSPARDPQHGIHSRKQKLRRRARQRAKPKPRSIKT